MNNNIVDLIVSLAAAAIPVIGAWATKEILGNKKVLAKASNGLKVMDIVTQLAAAAIYAAEKKGTELGLNGEEKKADAIKAVTEGLSGMGITSATQDTIANKVEQMFVNFKNAVESAYPDPEPKPAELPHDDSDSAVVSEMTPTKAADIAAQLGEIKQMIASSNATPATPETKVEG